MPKNKSDTSLAWIPSPDQSRVIDGLAMGLSQNAVARETGILQQTINHWVNDLSFSAEFRAAVVARSEMFQANLGAIEDQMVVQATALVARAIAGELDRDIARGGTQNPLRYDAAVEFLRATRWKRLAGEQHKQFGS